MTDFASPVFIVGSARSGTSVLIRSLQGAGYFGYNEGHFLSLIRSIERVVDRHYNIFHVQNDKVLVSRIDREAIKNNIADLLASEAVKQQARTPWVDKTGGPEMIESIPALTRIFPTSRFILAKRRGIENVVSRLSKFPKTSFREHCQGWTKTMETWLALRKQMPELACVEIDQRDISQTPDVVASILKSFLTLSPNATASIQRTFTRDRPQQTADGSSERLLSLRDVDWTQEMKDTFLEVCGPTMAAVGYTLDSRYRE